jgi:hypothetical protein
MVTVSIIAVLWQAPLAMRLPDRNHCRKFLRPPPSHRRLPSAPPFALILFRDFVEISATVAQGTILRAEPGKSLGGNPSPAVVLDDAGICLNLIAPGQSS